MHYYPVELLGSGQISFIYEKGYPLNKFFWKPEYFAVYYLGGLAFCILDLIWLIFIYERQSDFIQMLLHHFCTISLISFSYLTNCSNIGCIILFLHDVTDIFVYSMRLIVNSDLGSILKITSGLLLVTVFIYLRLYVFYLCIWAVFNLSGTEFGIRSEYIFVLFLTFLYIMHVFWVYQIFKKIYKAIFEDKFEDPGRLKKLVKKSK